MVDRHAIEICIQYKRTTERKYQSKPRTINNETQTQKFFRDTRHIQSSTQILQALNIARSIDIRPIFDIKLAVTRLVNAEKSSTENSNFQLFGTVSVCKQSFSAGRRFRCTLNVGSHFKRYQLSR